jgi:SAM-dependent methyltransferase
MSDYARETYGERWAQIYDEWVDRHATTPEGENVAERLAELAGGGRALELAIGTGRVALPLAARGVDVHGIDVSPAMVEQLRAKPGGADIPVTLGDFADVDVDGTFRLVFVVFNTLFALLEQDDQIRCFANVAQHLDDDGVFVIEAFVPDLARFDRGQRLETIAVETDAMQFAGSRHRPAIQRIDTLLVHIDGGDTHTYPVRLRYAWPSELDLMARLAGLRLRERWGGWDREPFTDASQRHVSVYAREARDG